MKSFDFSKKKITNDSIVYFSKQGTELIYEFKSGTRKIPNHRVKNIAQLWKGENSEIKEKLHANGIIPTKEFSVNDTLNLVTRQTYISEQKSKYGYKYIDSVRVNTSKNTITSMISTNEFSKLPPISIHIAGYLQSPFEEKVTIIMSYKSNGIHGPPYIISCTPIGGSIKTQ